MGFERLQAALTTPHNKWTPEQSYRWVVVPLAAWLILGGTALLAVFGAFGVAPTSPAPFIESIEGQRLFFSAVSVYLLAIGIGLLRRSLAAWYGFFAYFFVGTLYAVLGWMFDIRHGDVHWSLVASMIAFNTAFACAIYAAAGRVFKQASNGADSQQ